MIAEIGMGLSSLKAAMDLAQGLNAANNQAALNSVKIELQSRILEAQSALAAAREASFADAERIRELEQKIVQLKDWETEKQRYQLEAVDSGAFAYVAKPGMENGEPPHWLCAKCFQGGQKAILQRLGKAGQTALWQCNGCGAQVGMNAGRYPGQT